MINTNDYTAIYTLDCGRKTGTISKNGEPSTILNHKEFLCLPKVLDRGSLVICEYAHLGVPRGPLSLSQPFSKQELLALYKELANNDITLKLFPQKMMPTAISKSGLTKSDINDPVSIYRYVTSPDCGLHLQNPPTQFEDTIDQLKRQINREFIGKVEEGWLWKSDLNKHLNNARSDLYGLENPDSFPNTKFILDNIEYIYDNLSSDARTILKLQEFSKRSQSTKGRIKIKTKTNWSFKMSFLYTVLAILRDIEGNPIYRQHTKDFAGNYFLLRYVFCQTPNHLKGGVARSNLMWHNFRTHLITQGKEHGFDFRRKIATSEGEYRNPRRGDFTAEENEYFLNERRKFRKTILEVLNLFKSILRNEKNSTQQLTTADTIV